MLKRQHKPTRACPWCADQGIASDSIITDRRERQNGITRRTRRCKAVPEHVWRTIEIMDDEGHMPETKIPACLDPRKRDTQTDGP